MPEKSVPSLRQLDGLVPPRTHQRSIVLEGHREVAGPRCEASPAVWATKAKMWGGVAFAEPPFLLMAHATE